MTTHREDILSDLSTVFEDWDDATWNGATIKCIFDRTYEQSELGVENMAPTALVRSADVVGVAQGQNFSIGGVTYKIRAVHPDGTGTMLLILSVD